MQDVSRAGEKEGKGILSRELPQKIEGNFGTRGHPRIISEALPRDLH